MQGASDVPPTYETIGSYRLQRELGRGGMGLVFEAVHVLLPRRAAIKILHPELEPRFAAPWMLREAAILAHVRHPGVVRVYECGLLPDRRPWIAMELVAGETLACRLREVPRLAAIEVATLLGDIAEVLAVVHARDIVHRDLKPENLMLTPADREFPLRLIDWGIAHAGPLGGMSECITSGTPAYMSPEQAAGGVAIPADDLYALGVIAYEALAGRRPFEGRSLAEVAQQRSNKPAQLTEQIAPHDLRSLIDRLLGKEPNLRPSALEVCKIARDIRATTSDAGPVAWPGKELALTIECGVTESMPQVRCAA